MREQKDGSGIQNGPSADFHAKEQAKLHEQSELTNLFQESGLFDAHTPPGRDPAVFPMDALDHLRSDVAMKARRTSRYNRRLADQLESWKTSINKVNMAYEIIVYPFLDVAEQNFAQAPFKDPHASDPSAERLRITEGIRDAQVNPNQDLDEYPHRGPITLTPLETYLLGRLTQTRGLPFNPQKRDYHYLEHLPRLEARSQEAQRRYWQYTERAVAEGILRPRDEIEKEIRQRQEKWLRRPSSNTPPRDTPPKPRR
jgi:hypothetical protein